MTVVSALYTKQGSQKSECHTDSQLLISKDKQVILLVDKEYVSSNSNGMAGTVIYSGSDFSYVGEYSVVWARDEFKPYKGSVDIYQFKDAK